MSAQDDWEARRGLRGRRTKLQTLDAEWGETGASCSVELLCDVRFQHPESKVARLAWVQHQARTGHTIGRLWQVRDPTWPLDGGLFDPWPGPGWTAFMCSTRYPCFARVVKILLRERAESRPGAQFTIDPPTEEGIRRLSELLRAALGHHRETGHLVTFTGPYADKLTECM